MRIPDHKTRGPDVSPEQAPPPRADVQAPVGKDGPKVEGDSPLGENEGLAGAAKSERLGLQTQDGFQLGGPGGPQIAIETPEPTSTADLEVVGQDLEKMIETMGEKPNDVRLAGKLELNRPGLEQPIDSAAIPPQWVGELAQTLGTPGENTTFADGIAEALLTKDEIKEKLLTTLPPNGPQILLKITDTVKARFGDHLPANILKTLVGAKVAVSNTGDPKPTTATKATGNKLPTVSTSAKKTEPTADDLFPDLPPITIPGPELVKHEAAIQSALKGIDLGSADIDTLVQLVLMECGRDATEDLRTLLDEVKKNNAQKKLVRDHVATMKKREAETEAKLRREYDMRCASPDKNLHIDPEVTTFEDYCKSQRLELSRGDPSRTNADGAPDSDFQLGISPNVTYYPTKAEEVFDARGNPIPAMLVQIAKKLKVNPSDMAELRALYASDAKLRAKHASFEAFLLTATDKGGLGLKLPPSGDQSQIVNQFVAGWKAKNPNVSTESPVDAAPPPAQTGDALPLSSAQTAALKAYFTALNPSAKPDEFQAWLGSDPPGGPGIKTGMSDPTGAVNAFFKAAAQQPVGPTENPFATPDPSVGPNLESDIKATAEKLLTDPVKRAALHRALQKYVNATMALGAATAWSTDWLTEQRQAAQTARDELVAALGLFGDDLRGTVQNYVHALLVNGHKMLERSKNDSRVGDPFRRNSVLTQGLSGGNKENATDAKKGEAHWIWGPTEANAYDPMFAADAEAEFAQVTDDPALAKNQNRKAAVALAAGYVATPPAGSPPANATTNRMVGGSSSGGAASGSSASRMTGSTALRETAAPLSPQELAALQAQEDALYNNGMTYNETLRTLMSAEPSSQRGYNAEELELRVSVETQRGRIGSSSDAENLDSDIRAYVTMLAGDTCTFSDRLDKRHVVKTAESDLRNYLDNITPAARQAEARKYVNLRLAEIFRDLKPAADAPGNSPSMRNAPAFMYGGTNGYGDGNKWWAFGTNFDSPQFFKQDQLNLRSAIGGYLRNGSIDAYPGNDPQPAELTGKQIREKYLASIPRTPQDLQAALDEAVRRQAVAETTANALATAAGANAASIPAMASMRKLADRLREKVAALQTLLNAAKTAPPPAAPKKGDDVNTRRQEIVVNPSPANTSTANNNTNAGGTNTTNTSSQASGGADAALSALVSELLAPESGEKPRHYDGLREMSLDQLKALREEWEGKKDTLGDISQELALKLQLYQERRSKFMEMLSNIMKKSADTKGAITQNLK